jgi:hypothetical protein
MGYTTEFDGRIEIVPPLNGEEIAYLNLFAGTRRMDREEGPYHAEDDGDFGQSRAPGIRDYNRPPAGQPNLWCNWVPTDDGTAIEWNGGEKFYDASEWMAYIIDHFLKPGAAAPLPFLQKNHTLNGTIDAQGEDRNDRWLLVVEDNRVSTKQAQITFR